MIVVLATAAPAGAETELVVVGPTAGGKVTGAHLRHVKKTLVPAPDERALDTKCATDPACLAAIGTELGARRVAAVTVTDGAGDAMTLGFVLVDVQGKDLIGKRELATTDRKLPRELPAGFKKFLDDAPVERAKALFADGNQHYSLGEMEQALELYKAAYRIKALPAFLFNIAQCHRKLGHHQEAVTMYQSYLAGVPDAPNKTMVDSLIKESRDAIAAEQKAADDKASAATRLESERIAAEQQKAEAERKAKEAEAVAAVERRKAEQARIIADREREARMEKLYDHHPARKWSYLAGGLGAGALVAGSVFGFGARSAQHSFDNAGCGDPTRLLDAAQAAQCKSDRDRGQRDAQLTNILLGGGGALFVTAVLLLVVDPGNVERPDRAHVAVSPNSIQVVVRW